MADFKRGVKWWLFLSSYIPLYLILAIKHWNFQIVIPQNTLLIFSTVSNWSVPILSIGWILLTILSSLVLYLVFSLRLSRGATDFQRVESSRDRNDLITNYILVYIFPFVVLDFSNLTNWVAFVLFFVVIAIIQVRSNHLYVNPVLAAFNYRLYEVDTGDRVLTVVSKGAIDRPVEQIQTVELSNEVFLAT